MSIVAARAENGISVLQTAYTLAVDESVWFGNLIESYFPDGVSIGIYFYGATLAL